MNIYLYLASLAVPMVTASSILKVANTSTVI